MTITGPELTARRDSVSDRAVDWVPMEGNRLDVAREHTKRLFTRETLSSMSRIVLHAGVAAEVYLVLVLVKFVGVFGGSSTSLLPKVVYAAVVAGVRAARDRLRLRPADGDHRLACHDHQAVRNRIPVTVPDAYRRRHGTTRCVGTRQERPLAAYDHSPFQASGPTPSHITTGR